MKLYIGNVSYDTTESSLRAFFEEFGAIESLKIATDRDTGRSRGFAFIEFSDRNAAQEAMQARDGASLDGKQLRVNEARPKEAGSGSSRGGYGGNGGGNRYGGGRSSSGRGGYSGGGRGW